MNEEEINRLAGLAKNGTREEQDEAWRELVPEIKVLAYYAADKLGTLPRAIGGLIDEAPSIVFERLDRYDEGRPFRRWAFAVLRNWMIDENRKRRRKRKYEIPNDLVEDFPEISRGFEPRPYENLPDLDRPFSDADLTQLEKDHTAQARVIGLTIVNLWKNVPSERWQAWLAETDLPHDFPPQEMEQYDEYGERIERLAEMLHVSEQSLRML
ncbi:MAG: hypothetical protein GYA33_13475, partial [Thermogutta sp.]|nr:hypothetical protein [Thermogutta sp.]